MPNGTMMMFTSNVLSWEAIVPVPLTTAGTVR